MLVIVVIVECEYLTPALLIWLRDGSAVFLPHCKWQPTRAAESKQHQIPAFIFILCLKRAGVSLCNRAQYYFKFQWDGESVRGPSGTHTLVLLEMFLFSWMFNLEKLLRVSSRSIPVFYSHLVILISNTVPVSVLKILPSRVARFSLFWFWSAESYSTVSNLGINLLARAKKGKNQW